MKKRIVVIMLLMLLIGGMGGALPASAKTILNQDGNGFSGSIEGNEVIGETFTGYKNWPNGFRKGVKAFVGGVYDGINIWLVPMDGTMLR